MPRRKSQIRISINVKRYNKPNDNYKLELCKLPDNSAWIRFNNFNSKKIDESITLTEFAILFRSLLVKLWKQI
jgi:hypothetical protein